VQLIGTAHGKTLENLLLNPTLSDLVGGIESVTLSDEEARRRGTQKTVLERRAPPTFDVLIEIQHRDRLALHPDLAAAVDALVRGAQPVPETRYRDSSGEIRIEKAQQLAPTRAISGQGMRRLGDLTRVETPHPLREFTRMPEVDYERVIEEDGSHRILPEVRIYPYGVAKNRLMQSARKLSLPALVVKDVADAEVMVTLKTYYRSRQQPIVEAEHRGIPIYVLRANTNNQIEHSLAEIYHLSEDQGSARDWDRYSLETQSAIESVLNGQRWVDLPPAAPSIRRLQHDLARQSHLVSHSYGKEPNRRVRIFKE
jgi:hypothetical protein